MAQFRVFGNANPASRRVYPYLLDVQSDLVSGLSTRVVVPLCPVTAMKGKLIDTLMPVFLVGGKRYAMVTPELAGVARQHLGPEVADLSLARNEIVAALDLLFTGI